MKPPGVAPSGENVGVGPPGKNVAATRHASRAAPAGRRLHPAWPCAGVGVNERPPDPGGAPGPESGGRPVGAINPGI